MTLKLLGPVDAFQVLNEKFQLRTTPVVQIGEIFLISGMTGLDPATGEVAHEADFKEHARTALDNVDKMLRAAGLNLDHVVKVKAYLKNTEDFLVWNELFYECFTEPYPARTTVGAPLVVGLIEVEVVATTQPRVVR